MVRTKQSTTMLGAINFIKKEANIKYLQNFHASGSQSNFQILNKRNPAKQNSQNFSNQYPRPHFRQNFNPNSYQPNPQSFNSAPQNKMSPFPRGPISNIQPKPNHPQKFFSNQQVFGKLRNVFQPNPNYSNPNNQYKPTLMSIMRNCRMLNKLIFQIPSNRQSKNNSKLNIPTIQHVRIFNWTQFNSRHVIEFNTSCDKWQLPYITINQPPLKLLIDTGATKSFLDPEIVNKHFSEFKTHDPFVLSTSFASSKYEFSVTIPTFQNSIKPKN